jgi:hypothetical protein
MNRLAKRPARCAAFLGQACRPAVGKSRQLAYRGVLFDLKVA